MSVARPIVPPASPLSRVRARRDRLSAAAAVVGALGLAIAAYLTYVHYAKLHAFCLAGDACERVQTSRFSTLASVPVALIGIVGYATILLSLLARGATGRLVTAGLCAFGVCLSAYLTWAELFRIHAVCQWCVASAVLMCVLLGVAAARVVTGPAALRR